MKKIAQAIGLALLSSAFGTSLTAQELPLPVFGAGAQIVQYRDAPLTKLQRSAMLKFQRRSAYFGAFAIHPENGAWGWVTGQHRQDFAEIGATETCNNNSPTNGCVLIAAALPKSLSSNTRNAAGLNHDAQVGFEKGFRTAVADQRAGRFAAFAIGGAAWSYHANARTPEVAARTAKRQCERIELKVKRRTERTVVEALEPLGKYDCKIIAVTP